MKVLAVRQPWAWLIVNGFKDIEIRTWRTHYRGPLLILASARLPTKRELEESRRLARERGVDLPGEFETGGIVGMVELQHCVTSSASPWFHGPIGWVLTNARKTPFIRIKGRLGLFDAPLTGDVARTLKSAPR